MPKKNMILFKRSTGREVAVHGKKIEDVLTFIDANPGSPVHMIALGALVRRDEVNIILECEKRAQPLIKAGKVSPMNENGHGAYPIWFLRNLTKTERERALEARVNLPAAYAPGALHDPAYAEAYTETVNPVVEALSRANLSPKRVSAVIEGLETSLENITLDAQTKSEQLLEAQQLLALNTTLIAKLSGHKGPLPAITKGNPPPQSGGAAEVQA